MRAAAVAFVLLLAACGGELESGSLLERPRVLGVRVEVDGAPERAAPAPGETIALRWLVASPDDVAWTAAMSVCVAAPSQLGFAACAGEPFATGVTMGPTLEPTVSMTLPGPEAFVGTPGDLLVLGIFCAGGVPTMEGCSAESADSEIVTFSFPADLGEQPPNLHPSIVDETFSYDDTLWSAPPTDLPSSNCAAQADEPGLPHVRWRAEDDEPRIGITTKVEDRDAYVELVFGETLMMVDSREELTIAHIASAGRIARLETAIFDDASLDVDVPWRHPEQAEIPADGLTVEFIFVMRDGRGGMDWTHRALCLLP